MVGAGDVIVPTFQDLGYVVLVCRRQRGSEPSVRERMQMPEAFGQIVERHDVPEAKCDQRSFERHVGRHGDADREASFALVDFRHVVGMPDSHFGPVGIAHQLRRIAVDDQCEVFSHGFQEIAGETTEISRPVQRQRPIRRCWRKSAGFTREFGHERQCLAGIRQPIE
jgi:hypothetical protein